jgi:glucan phosphoethanolaminetransferase (alkaline phosphatase superfamily)
MSTKILRKLRDRLAPIRGLLYLAVFQLLFSAAYITFFSIYFQFNKSLIAVHLLLTLGLLIITILLMSLPLAVVRLRQWRVSKYLLSLIPALTFLCLLLIYIADFVSNSFWGSNINYTIVADYVFQFNAILKALPINASWFWLIIGVVSLSIILLFQLFSEAIFGSLQALTLPTGEWSLFKSRARTLKSALAFILFVALMTGFISLLWVQRSQYDAAWRDPLISFFLPTITYLEPNPHRLQVYYQDQRSRAEYPRAETFQKKNVILIIADALRADHMQVYGYERPTTPFLAKLQQSGSLKKVDFAVSSCSDTVCGIMSTMASKNLKNVCNQNFTVYDLLNDQGYESYFILSGSHSWYGLREYYGEKNLKLYFDGESSKAYTLNDDRLIFEGLEQVDNFSGKPAFFYFHLMSPHYSGAKLDKFSRYAPKDKKLEVYSFLGGDYDATLVKDNYDDKVMQADGMIQQLFDNLRQKGYLKNSLVLIIGDHGDGLGEHGHFGHVHYLYQEQLRVPFLIYDEERVRYTNLRFASQLDVAPTIIDRLGLQIPACWEGDSLLKSPSKLYTYHQSFGNPLRYAVLYRTDKAIFKYILTGGGEQEEIYELISDPHEQTNLMQTADAALVQNLKDKLRQHFESSTN